MNPPRIHVGRVPCVDPHGAPGEVAALIASGEVATLIASGEVAALIASGEVAALIAFGEARVIANYRSWLVNTPTMTDNSDQHNRMIGYLTPDDGSAGAFDAMV